LVVVVFLMIAILTEVRWNLSVVLICISFVCLMKLGALTLSAYRLIIVISFWCIAPCISMKCLSLSHLTNVNSKSTLSKYCYSCLFSRAIGLVNFLPSFHLSQCLFLSIRWVSCKQQIVGSSFLIQFAKWYLLMGELSPLTFMLILMVCGDSCHLLVFAV
jgi:hypothetical protein